MAHRPFHTSGAKRAAFIQYSTRAPEVKITLEKMQPGAMPTRAVEAEDSRPEYDLLRVYST
jgi:hypothetical protein